MRRERTEGHVPSAEPWQLRLRTGHAIAILCWARLMVATVPFHRWRRSLGTPASESSTARRSPAALAAAQRFARHVDRAAQWLPFPTRCLPRAMALSWILRRERIGHALVFAVRPAHLRDRPDALHAWVEVNGAKILGDLPGPWLETLRVGT